VHHIFFPYRPGLTSMQHAASHTTAVQPSSHNQRHELSSVLRAKTSTFFYGGLLRWSLFYYVCFIFGGLIMYSNRPSGMGVNATETLGGSQVERRKRENRGAIGGEGVHGVWGGVVPLHRKFVNFSSQNGVIWDKLHRSTSLCLTNETGKSMSPQTS